MSRKSRAFFAGVVRVASGDSRCLLASLAVAILLTGCLLRPASICAADDARLGTNGLFDGLARFNERSAPVVCLISTQALDEIREEIKKAGRLKKVEQLRSRIEELSGRPCLVVHYTQIMRGDLDRPNVRAIVLTAWKKLTDEVHAREIDGLIRQTKTPLIAFCGGHHLLYLTYGGQSGIMRRLKPREQDPNPNYMPGLFKEWGYCEVRIVMPDPIFEGLPETMIMPERHYAECKVLPEEFDLLASSDECKVQMIQHKTRCVYGTQFHPEIYDDVHPHGKVLLENFFRIAGERRQ